MTTTFDPSDTICAISTAPGIGGIAVARISGPQAIDILGKMWAGKDIASLAPRTVHLGNLLDSRGEVLDKGIITIYRAPASYTGEDTVEIAVHGSRWIQQELIATLCSAGARLAEPGEFTRRAVKSGRMDLAEADGVADLIASRSRGAHRLAMKQMRGDLSRRLNRLRDSLLQLASLLELELDFGEEDVEFASRETLSKIATDTLAEINRLKKSFASGNAILEGIPVAIAGATNAGKSSLLNAIVGDDKAIVSDIPGTTRDIVEDTVNLGDYTFRILDTAGLRHATDPIEKIGIERTMKAVDSAQIIILVLDSTDDIVNYDIVRNASRPLWSDDSTQLIIAVNKTDLPMAPSFARHLDWIMNSPTKLNWLKKPIRVDISAKDGTGLDTLRDTLIDIATGFEDRDDIIITNEWHRTKLMSAAVCLESMLGKIERNISPELVAQDLRQALHSLGQITGEITSDEILANIFSRFCIGK